MKIDRSTSEDTRKQTLTRSRRVRNFAFAIALLTGCAEGSISEYGDPAARLDNESEEAETEAPEQTPSIGSDAGTKAPSVKGTAVADSGTSKPAPAPVREEQDVPESSSDVGGSDASAPAPVVPSTNSGTKALTYSVKDGKIFDGCGEEFVMRGVNHPTIYTDRAGAAFPEIARTGANTVRLFWFGTHGVAIKEIEPAINRAVENGMLPMIEMHDSTCKWDVDPIIEQWIKPDVVALIKKHEQHLMVNIANEASYPNANEFVSKYKTAITKMRNAGIHVPLVIDGGRCGRDYDTLLNRGKELLDFDPDHNLIFSTHLYDALDASAYTAMFAKARSLQLPFIVGEFANKEPPGCGKTINYAALINEAQKAGIGWLAWSWGDNSQNTIFNTDCQEFDMTSTFAFDSLHGWGKAVSVDDGASIQKTSKRPYALTHSDVCK